jgi:hypothetical protein
MWRTEYWRLPRSHCADFQRNRGCPKALVKVLWKNRSFMRTISPWSTAWPSEKSGIMSMVSDT